MVQPQGYKYLLAQPTLKARVIAGGVRCETKFPADPGYPRFGDDDPANYDSGEFVLTWRFTIPAGTHWGATPATKAEMLADDGTVVWKGNIPELRCSVSHPCKLYINLLLRSTTQ